MRSLFNPAVPLALTLPMLAGAAASAEERCKLTWKVSAADTNFPQQLMMDVDDVPGHRIGTYELHRTFAEQTSSCEGLKIAEQWTHGFRDLVDRNGRAWAYSVLTLDNGDKIYLQLSGTVQTEVAADGSARSTYEGVNIWTGGTGRYQNVRGLQREHATVEYAAGGEAKSAQGRVDGEYWFEK
jgi:hypothetical protein